MNNKPKRSPIVQVVVPAGEYLVLQEMALRERTSVSAVARKLLLGAPAYQQLKKEEKRNEK